MIDLRSWLKDKAEYPHWIGLVATDVFKAGWAGSSVTSLKEWAREREQLPTSAEIDNLLQFYLLELERQKRRHG